MRKQLSRSDHAIESRRERRADHCQNFLAHRDKQQWVVEVLFKCSQVTVAGKTWKSGVGLNRMQAIKVYIIYGYT